MVACVAHGHDVQHCTAHYTLHAVCEAQVVFFPDHSLTQCPMRMSAAAHSGCDGRLPICIGTDCTGLGSVFIALTYLNIAYRHVFGSEIDEWAQRQLLHTFPPEYLVSNMRLRSTSDVPSVDLYCCGFPCQAFSTAGNRAGFNSTSATGDGSLFFHVHRLIRRTRPRCFLLENVQGLETVDEGRNLSVILHYLYSLRCYNIYWALVNTKDHGIPHNRPRYYFVGILQEFDQGSFCWPQPLPLLPLENFLDDRLQRPSWYDLPSQPTAQANVLNFLRQVASSGDDPFDSPWIIDCDSSASRVSGMRNCSPCLTRSRAAGHWVTSRGRRMTLSEQMRLQGINPPFPVAVPPVEFGRLLGNSMSVNILERILCSLLPAAGLWDAQHLVDRYS